MKIALNLSGHVRCYQECYPSIKEHLLDKMDCDVFINTYSNIGRVWGNNNFHNILDPNNVSNANEVNTADLSSLYKPKLLQVKDNRKCVEETYKEYGHLTRSQAECVAGGFFHEYRFWVCAEMFKMILENNTRIQKYSMDTGIKYDYVVRARFDNRFLSFVPEYMFARNKVLVSHLGFPIPGSDDQFFVGDWKSMMKLTDGLLAYLESYKNKTKLDFYISEQWFRKGLDEMGIPYEVVDPCNQLFDKRCQR